MVYQLHVLSVLQDKRDITRFKLFLFKTFIQLLQERAYICVADCSHLLRRECAVSLPMLLISVSSCVFCSLLAVRLSLLGRHKSWFLLRSFVKCFALPCNTAPPFVSTGFASFLRLVYRSQCYVVRLFDIATTFIYFVQSSSCRTLYVREA